MKSCLEIAASAAMLFCFGLPDALAAELTITVDNLRNDRGQVILCVFSAENSDKASFPDCVRGRPVRQGKAIISGGKVVMTYTGLKDGVYAVAAVHDENGNGQLDTNFLGIPTEGIAISMNPRLMGKPSFDEARFEIKGKTAITVNAIYIL
jgi:uncharacterized protein (DUF2141 family)